LRIQRPSSGHDTQQVPVCDPQSESRISGPEIKGLNTYDAQYII